jgi:glycosyltransferase involved in cell wall biosynthesis
MSSMLRIAHVSDCYLPRVGGIETQVHGLALRQQRRGNHVQVITSVGVEADGLADDVPVLRPAARSGGAAGRIRYGHSWAARRAVRAGRYDVVHAHLSTFSPLALLNAAAAARAGVPTVITMHSLLGAAPLGQVVDLLSPGLARQVTWTAVSDRCAADLRRALGGRRAVSVLPNGVDVAAWRQDCAPRAPGRLVIVSVGRLARRKRPHQLLRMLREARARIPPHVDVQARIIGDGPLYASLRRDLARHGMSDWARLLGGCPHSRIREIYRDADLYVAPAKLESFGIAALEARCAGLPVIAYARTGVADYIVDGRDGLLVEDDAAMVDALTAAATSPGRLAAIRSHNACHPPSVSWAEVLDRTEEIYAPVAPATRSPSSVAGAE